MSQYIEDLKKLNKKHEKEDCFTDEEDFFNTVVLGSSCNTDLSVEDATYDLEKAKFLQEQILILQSELGIEDEDLNQMLTDIVASSVGF